jgi:FkbM family methyltransferase
MIKKVLRKYRAEGFHGVGKAIIRKFFRSSPSPHPVRLALNELASQDGFCVIQIGAFVGNTDNDPLYEILSKQLQQLNGTLIVVEPVKSFFEELVRNYSDIPGVIFENVAISDRNGSALFYRLGVDPVEYGYPAWLSQLGSLKEERMGLLWDSHDGIYNADEYKDFYLKHRVEETVNCITFTDLIKRHNLSRIDLLQIDVEGYELEILKTIDFQKCPIRFVNFESVLLQDQKSAAEQLMLQNGYRFVDYYQDTFCYKKIDKHLI